MGKLVNSIRCSGAIGLVLVVTACAPPSNERPVSQQRAPLVGPYCIETLPELQDFATAYASSVGQAQTDCGDPDSGLCNDSLDAMLAAQDELEAAQARFLSACPEEPVCVPGEALCLDASTLSLCNADGSAYVPMICENQACVAGQCAGECVPGETRCAGNAIETCGPNGSWATSAICENGACQNGACQAQTCTPGTRECANSDELRECSALGVWQLLEQCENGACQNGACQAQTCTPGTRECTNSDELRECSALGDWQLLQQCENGACQNGACQAQTCTPGTRECTNSDELRECSALGDWQQPQQCAEQACVDGSCIGQCSPGSGECAGNYRWNRCSATGEFILERFCWRGCGPTGCR